MSPALPARFRRSAAALLLATVAFAPLAAQRPAADDPATEAAILRAQEAAAAEDCAGVLGALDPVVPTLAEGPDRAMVQRLRLLCLAREGRVGELPAVQRELAVALPRDGLVGAFGVIIALEESRFVEAADKLTTLAETAPASLDILTGEAVRQIASSLREGSGRKTRDRMLIALSRADWMPSDIPDLRSWIARDAIGALIARGETDEAELLLDRIDRPEALASMLIDRRYAPIWRTLEARFGPAGGASVDEFARERLAAFADMPDSEGRLRDAAVAMLMLGRYEDVVGMTDEAVIRDGMSREAIEIVRWRGHALAMLGRHDEVTTLLDGFLSLDPARTPGLASAFIDYAEYLDASDRPARALEVVRIARAHGQAVFSSYRERWLDRTEVCALSALGRIAEARVAMDALKGHVAENASAVIEALLCVGRAAEASAIAVRMLADKDMEPVLLSHFQPSGSYWAALPSRLRAMWDAFLARPEVKTAVERRGRFLPRDLWPATEPRPVPRRPAGDVPLA